MADAPRGLRSETESVEALVGREVAEPTVPTEWTQEEARRRKAAPMRIYLGAAPGVGKTYAMLSEGQRRLERGTDVVVGFVATYGTPQTVAILDGLEIVPMKALDYLTKPFGVDELLARIRALLRRTDAPQDGPQMFEAGGVTVDLDAHRVMRDGRDVHLTRMEWDLLEALAAHPSKLLTHRWLLAAWGEPGTRTTSRCSACSSASFGASSNPTSGSRRPLGRASSRSLPGRPLGARSRPRARSARSPRRRR